jgi:adenosyl cobinamide kinase/adenosyl cobinamide phosphate guanylyltransferase
MKTERINTKKIEKPEEWLTLEDTCHLKYCLAQETK